MFWKKKDKYPVFLTVTIGDKCWDYPKDVPLPRIGERVFMGTGANSTGIVERVNHHVTPDGELFAIYIYANDTRQK